MGELHFLSLIGRPQLAVAAAEGDPRSTLSMPLIDFFG